MIVVYLGFLISFGILGYLFYINNYSCIHFWEYGFDVRVNEVRWNRIKSVRWCKKCNLFQIQEETYNSFKNIEVIHLKKIDNS